MHEACIALQDVARIVDGEVNKESLLGWNLEQDPRDLRNAQTPPEVKPAFHPEAMPARFPWPCV
jgi:hypothetical protein